MGRPWIALVLLAACSPGDAPPAGARAAAEPPSILLVTLDTTRADHIGVYGHDAADTPTLDRLARQGVRFESALAQVPVTLPSHTSILTGVIPPVHGVRDNGIFALAPEAVLLPEVLRERGWRTGAFVGSYVLAPRFGLEQGFEVYRAPVIPGRSRISGAERPADEVVDDAVAWLGSLEPSERFFAWLHFYDPHGPHAAPEPWASAHADPYDAEIAFCDAQVARLLRFLGGRGLDANLLVAVTADHGESFGEHGEASHGAFLYDATLRVPLILSGPPVAHRAGGVVRARVSNAALAPTLLELAGIPRRAMPAVAAPSLLAEAAEAAEAEENEADPRPVYIETYYPYHSLRWHAFRGLVWQDHKLIEGKQPELYDLASDPDELRDRAAEDPERLARMRARLAALLETRPSLGWAGESRLDPTEQAALEALGYLEAHAGGDPFDPALPDARDLIGDLERVERASELASQALQILGEAPPAAWQRHEHEERARVLQRQARDLLARALANNPDSPIILHRLANAELALANYDEATPLLETVVSQRPNLSVGHYNLGLAYLEQGREADGLRALERAIELEPEQPRYHLELARRLYEAGDWDRCAEQLDQLTARLAPDDPMLPGVRALEARLERDRRAAGGPDA